MLIFLVTLYAGNRMRLPHKESHLIERTGWLRAAVLGANDGIISTASLILGVTAAAGTQHNALVAGVAGLVAGAMAMAAGEYVSVSSQADTEAAALATETAELLADPDSEADELTRIYVTRGVSLDLARQVSQQLMAKDALGAHARDELGISSNLSAKPVQAALASALMFSAGAAAPLVLAAISPSRLLMPVIVIGALICLAILGAIGAKAGGAPLLRPTLRVVFWGMLAMVATTGIGRLFGAAV
jgi:VIT1/CCC1 family predicted Fe2+/Mn2+ transporter